MEDPEALEIAAESASAADPDESEVGVEVEPVSDPEVEVEVEVEAEVDGTVAMEVPAFEALPTSPLQEEPFVQQDLDLDGDGDLDMEGDGDGDELSGRDETVAMMAPDQHVSPNAGE